MLVLLIVLAAANTQVWEPTRTYAHRGAKSRESEVEFPLKKTLLSSLISTPLSKSSLFLPPLCPDVEKYKRFYFVTSKKAVKILQRAISKPRGNKDQENALE